MKLQAGKTYETRSGEIVTVERRDGDGTEPYQFVATGDQGYLYTAEGNYWDDGEVDGNDIIREVTKSVLPLYGHTGSGMLLPTDPAERKAIPLTTGVIDYFPLALAEVARLSKVGNDQHNPGEPLHWDKSKSTDHADTIGRHLIDRGKRDTDGQRHSAKLAWRALALLQIELENEAKQ